MRSAQGEVVVEELGLGYDTLSVVEHLVSCPRSSLSLGPATRYSIFASHDLLVASRVSNGLSLRARVAANRNPHPMKDCTVERSFARA